MKRFGGMHRFATMLWMLAVTIVSGCGKPYQIAEVDGVLVAKGKPAHKVRIQFIPDIDKGAKGPPSSAETDANGKFTLQYAEPGGNLSQPGAVVGWHRVVLSDLQLSESPTGQG